MEQQKIIDRHLLANLAKMLDTKVALVDIADRVQDTQNTNEGWVVKKMRSKYVNKIAAILPTIY